MKGGTDFDMVEVAIARERDVEVAGARRNARLATSIFRVGA